MKKLFLSAMLAIALCTITQAQDIDNNPGAYMTAVHKTHLDMDKKYMQYTSAVAHGKRARKVEKLRQQVLESITNTRDKIADIPFYKGDKSLRQSNLEYVDFCYTIFNDDYAKIVNTEEIAEQSFDGMQAYILLQEQIDEKLKQATDKVNKASKDFAAKYKVNIIDGEKSELSQKLEQAHKVSKYYNQIHLLFFKCNWQNNKLTQAINEKKLNDAEQARTSVIKYANEGLAALDKFAAFEGDPSVKMACKQALVGFKAIAEKETLVQTDFILKSENFEKIKKAYETKGESGKTKEDIDAYNKAVKEINIAVNNSNKASADSNNKQNEIFKNWEEAVSTFFNTHTPKY